MGWHGETRAASDLGALSSESKADCQASSWAWSYLFEGLEGCGQEVPEQSQGHPPHRRAGPVHTSSRPQAFLMIMSCTKKSGSWSMACPHGSNLITPRCRFWGILRHGLKFVSRKPGSCLLEREVRSIQWVFVHKGSNLICGKPPAGCCDLCRMPDFVSFSAMGEKNGAPVWLCIHCVCVVLCLLSSSFWLSRKMS